LARTCLTPSLASPSTLSLDPAESHVTGRRRFTCAKKPRPLSRHDALRQRLRPICLWPRATPCPSQRFSPTTSFLLSALLNSAQQPLRLIHVFISQVAQTLCDRRCKMQNIRDGLCQCVITAPLSRILTTFIMLVRRARLLP
jgi:hypothetical protein